MLASLTAEDFAPLVNSRFVVEGDGHAALELITVTPARHPSPQGRRGFSLTFLGTPEAPLSQGIHTLRHTTFGELALFLVPLGPQGSGLRYEAIFN